MPSASIATLFARSEKLADAGDLEAARKSYLRVLEAAPGHVASMLQLSYIESLLGGYRAARALLAADDRPTAVFAASDEMAFGVVFAARELGLSIPDDVAIVGVDGHEQSVLFDLTTVEQFPRAQGVRAAETVLARLDGAATATDLPFQLVVRGSTVAGR